MDSQLKNLFLFIAAIVLLGLYLSAKVDWEDMLQPHAQTPIHLNGKIAPSQRLCLTYG